MGVALAKLWLWHHSDAPPTAEGEVNPYLFDYEDRHETPGLKESLDYAHTEHAAVQPTNPHGHAAAARTSSDRMCDAIAARLGLPLYSVACSTKDIRRGITGSRQLYDAKDVLTFSERCVAPVPGTGTVFKLHDTLDHLPRETIARLLARGQPALAYGWALEAVAVRSNEVSVWFNPTVDRWVFEANRAPYEHELWDFEREELATVVNPSWRELWATWMMFGIGRTLVAYFAPRITLSKVYRRDLGESRAMIAIEPRTTLSPAASLVYGSKLLADHGLRRLRPDLLGGSLLAKATIAALKVRTCEGLYRSYSNVGYCSSVTVPEALCADIASLIRFQRRPPSAGVVESMAKRAGLSVTNGQACLLVDGISAGLPKTVVSTYTRETPAVSSYTIKPGPSYEDPQRLPVRAYATPFVAGMAFTHENNEEAALAAKAERIVKPRNEVEPPAEFYNHGREFARRVIGASAQGGTLYPADDDAIMDRIKRKSQVAGILAGLAAEVDAVHFREVLRSFLKSEVYQEVKDPRIITQAADAAGVAYARFIIALDEVVKERPWYAFSKTPRGTAEAVARILTGAKGALGSDFSRFDGRVSAFLRWFEALFSEAFAEEHRSMFEDLHSLSYNNTVNISGFVKFQQKYARASGLRDTSLFNTLINAFVAFCAYYRQYRSYDAAWVALEKGGLYGGDDGLSANLDKQCYESCCVDLGLVTKTEGYALHDPVLFLSRVYGPGVWFGDPNSMTDPLRAISKLHTTTLPLTVPDTQIMHWKAMSYYATDACTPLLGQVCHAVITHFAIHAPTLYPGDLFEQYGGATYASEQTARAGEGFGEFPADWKWEYLEKQLAGAQYHQLLSWCDALIAGQSELLRPWGVELITPETAPGAIVNGMLHPEDGIEDCATSAPAPNRGPAAERPCSTCGKEIVLPKLLDTDRSRALHEKALRWTQCRDCKSAAAK